VKTSLSAAVWIVTMRNLSVCKGGTVLGVFRSKAAAEARAQVARDVNLGVIDVECCPLEGDDVPVITVPRDAAVEACPFCGAADGWREIELRGHSADVWCGHCGGILQAG
jgi:predicted RNA-binding Zn-ribbon protein involved in translation (DUF1610 family)